ncbi:MAG: IS66 family transposase [Rhodocyclaceae bacterium]|nr:IS66 family transposase [Rhodocyclaceae bacterium]
MNENTPSSAIPVYIKPVMKSPNRLPVGTNPRGKPKGGNGATRKNPKKVDRKIKVKFSKKELKQLKEKHSDKLTFKKIRLYSWEIPEIKTFVTQFTVQRAYVGKKLVAQAVHPELPKSGIFGNRLKALSISLRNGFAGSCDKISTFIEELTGESFSAQSIKDCAHRVGKELEPDYKDLESELRNSDVVGGDESGWRINGGKFWLWLFCTANRVFITIEKSRGREVIAKIFGTQFDGTFISDCLQVYREFAKHFQKCWAHLLRTTHTLAGLNPKKDIAKLHRWLDNLFNEMKKFLEKDPTPDEREKMHKKCKRKFDRIINYRWKSKDAKSIIKNRLKSFDGHWLTALLIRGVSLTNNKTEQHIRATIPTRKLLGCHRTEDGAKYFAISESLRQTWKLRGLSPYHEMVNKFREINMNQAL